MAVGQDTVLSHNPGATSQAINHGLIARPLNLHARWRSINFIPLLLQSFTDRRRRPILDLALTGFVFQSNQLYRFFQHSTWKLSGQALPPASFSVTMRDSDHPGALIFR